LGGGGWEILGFIAGRFLLVGGFIRGFLLVGGFIYQSGASSLVGGFITRCTMHKGGAPAGKRRSTLDKERKQEEENDPEKRQKRLELEATAKHGFFAPVQHSAAEKPAAEKIVIPPLLFVIPPLPAKDLRQHNELYVDLGGTVVRWHASSKCVVCTCDSTSQCGGNRRPDRCKTKRDPGSEQPAVTCAVTRGGGEVVATATTTSTLLPREVRAVEVVKVIPASQSPRHCEIVVLGNGRWGQNLENLPGYTLKGYQSAGAKAVPFPLRPGATWLRIIGGPHARVLGKDKVTIRFEISMSSTNPARPLFWARDFHEGPFSPSVSSVSQGALELAWLSQKHGDDDVKLCLSDMKGARFTGLDIWLLGAHFRSVTAGFHGFREGVQGRGRGKDEVGERQTRRLAHSLLEDFKAALGRACPTDLVGAFEMLQNSQAFQAEFQSGLKYRFSQDDRGTQALVKLYTKCIEKKDSNQARYILSLYSPWHKREDTMIVFHCTEHACKSANLFHRLRDLPEPVHRVRLSVFRKNTVKHMEDFCLRPDNVMRAAFSDRACQSFLRFCCRNRLFHKYSLECERLGIKPMGKTAFYKFYSEKVFKDMTRKTCACSVCVNKGGVAFDTFRCLVTEVFRGTELCSKYLSSITNLEHFMERNYRSMLQRSSKDSNVCMTFALSNEEDENFRCRCDHEHTPNCEILQQDVALFLSLREDITLHSMTEDLPDNLWVYQRAVDLYDE
jgi:hypothetical protein